MMSLISFYDSLSYFISVCDAFMTFEAAFFTYHIVYINFKRQYKVLIYQNLRTPNWAALTFLSPLDFCFFAIDFFNFFIRDYRAPLSINVSTEFRFLFLILNSKRLLPSWALRSIAFAAFSTSSIFWPTATSIQHSPSYNILIFTSVIR